MPLFWYVHVFCVMFTGCHLVMFVVHLGEWLIGYQRAEQSCSVWTEDEKQAFLAARRAEDEMTAYVALPVIGMYLGYRCVVWTRCWWARTPWRGNNSRRAAPTDAAAVDRPDASQFPCTDMRTATALAATAALLVTVTLGFSFVYRVYSETVPWLERVHDQNPTACGAVADLALQLCSKRVQAGVVASLFFFVLLGVVWFLDRCGVWTLHEGVVATVATALLVVLAVAFGVTFSVLVARLSDAAIVAEDLSACLAAEAPTAGLAGRAGAGVLICAYTVTTVLFAATLPLVARWLGKPTTARYKRVHISTDVARVIEHDSRVNHEDEHDGDDVVFPVHLN